MDFSVTRDGKDLSKDLYFWNKETKVFSTNENDLDLDFSNINHCTFRIGSGCKIKAGSCCIFNTFADCEFKTGGGCVFYVYERCIFSVGFNCVIVRKDTDEVLFPLEKQKIKLKSTYVKGYYILKETKTIIIDGKEIEISLESYNQFKEQFK